MLEKWKYGIQFGVPALAGTHHSIIPPFHSSIIPLKQSKGCRSYTKVYNFGQRSKPQGVVKKVAE